jgi:Flavin containing amine oxidoreductase
VLGLLAAYGLKTFGTYATGATRLDVRGRVTSFSGTVPPLPPNELAALGPGARDPGRLRTRREARRAVGECARRRAGHVDGRIVGGRSRRDAGRSQDPHAAHATGADGLGDQGVRRLRGFLLARPGLSGQAQSDRFPVVATFDESPAGGAPGIIFGLIAGRNAQRWAARPSAERRAAVLRQYAAFLGAEAMTPIDYLEVDWALQPYVQGGAAMFLEPGTLTEYGPALRAPVGRIHWASTETATRFWGDMDGAISAGERAAAATLR